MRLKKIVLLVITVVFVLMLGAIIFLAIRMNGEHAAYVAAAEELENAQRSIQGLNDQLTDAKRTIAEYEGVEFDEEAEQEDPLAGLSISDIATFDLSDEMTIKLAADPEVSEDHYVKAGITLSLNTKNEDYATYSETLASNEGLIMDSINKVIGKYTYTKIQKIKVTDVQNAILKELRRMYDSDFIVAVSFSSWYIQ